MEDRDLGLEIKLWLSRRKHVHQQFKALKKELGLSHTIEQRYKMQVSKANWDRMKEQWALLTRARFSLTLDRKALIKAKRGHHDEYAERSASP